jgi:hypothetical protein
MGLNAIGRGTLTVEDSTVYGNALVNFRADYGSTWEGDLVIRNCHWVPGCGETRWPRMVQTRNDGMHDFGYACSMPREISIDGLFVDDKNHPQDYQGMYFFSDPDNTQAAHFGGKEFTLPAERPFPYQRCQKLRVRGLSTASGKKPRVSPNAELQQGIVVVEEE